MSEIEKAWELLSADPEVLPWKERVALVEKVFATPSQLARHSNAPALRLLHILAVDPKWEVRKEVAQRINSLPEDVFTAFASTLSEDENAFVRSAAQRGIERHRKGQKASEIKGRKLQQMESDLLGIEKEFGPDAAIKVRRATQVLFEKFVGTSVHELRSVLTSLVGNIEALERSGGLDAPSAINCYVPRLKNQTVFMEKLLDDMRDYTRVLSSERKPERLSEMVMEALGMVRSQFEGEKLDTRRIKLDIELNVEIVFPCARMEIVLAFRNIIKNAFDSFLIDPHTLADGEVSITMEKVDGVIQICVTDTGMGLSERECQKVSYFIPTASSKGRHGTGYGLPIAYRNITAHGGKISLTSQEDKGTTVTIEFFEEAKDSK